MDVRFQAAAAVLRARLIQHLPEFSRASQAYVSFVVGRLLEVYREAGRNPDEGAQRKLLALARILFAYDSPEYDSLSGMRDVFRGIFREVGDFLTQHDSDSAGEDLLRAFDEACVFLAGEPRPSSPLVDGLSRVEVSQRSRLSSVTQMDEICICMPRIPPILWVRSAPGASLDSFLECHGEILLFSRSEWDPTLTLYQFATCYEVYLAALMIGLGKGSVSQKLPCDSAAGLGASPEACEALNAIYDAGVFLPGRGQPAGRPKPAKDKGDQSAPSDSELETAGQFSQAEAADISGARLHGSERRPQRELRPRKDRAAPALAPGPDLRGGAQIYAGKGITLLAPDPLSEAPPGAGRGDGPRARLDRRERGGRGAPRAGTVTPDGEGLLQAGPTTQASEGEAESRPRDSHVTRERSDGRGGTWPGKFDGHPYKRGNTGDFGQTSIENSKEGYSGPTEPKPDFPAERQSQATHRLSENCVVVYKLPRDACGPQFFEQVPISPGSYDKSMLRYNKDGTGSVVIHFLDYGSAKSFLTRYKSDDSIRIGDSSATFANDKLMSLRWSVIHLPRN